MSDAKRRALEAGRGAFGQNWRPDRVAHAPGRLELLGNHVDYNGGQVLAAAIDRDVVCLSSGGIREGEIVAVFADRNPSQAFLMRPAALGDWRIPGGSARAADYLRGVIATGRARGIPMRTGVRLAIAGDVPIGFGLSSSAALCVALTLTLHADDPAPMELVRRAQEAEHRAGTPCGTMDQSASVAGNVILFEGASLSFKHLQPNLGPYAFAVADSGVSRSLSTSSYSTRVDESNQAVAQISRQLGRSLPSLGALAESDLQNVANLLDPILLKRARHIVSEVARVRAGVTALRANDWPAFGTLMNESGQSSAFDYEISHPRVEELVSEALGVPGVLGARMMGGGEGGTALILLARDAFPTLVQRLGEGFYQRHRLGEAAQRVLLQSFGPGARRGAWSEPAG